MKTNNHMLPKDCGNLTTPIIITFW